MKKYFLTFLLLGWLNSIAQIPLFFYGEGITDNLDNIVTDVKGNKWLVIFSSNSKDTETSNIPIHGLLFDLNTIDSAHTHYRAIQKNLSGKTKNDTDYWSLNDELNEFKLDLWKYFEGNQIDSLIKTLGLTFTPIKTEFNKNFNFKIILKKVYTVKCPPNTMDCFAGQNSEYKLMFYAKKKLLYSREFNSKFISKKELISYFSQALCWQYKNVSFGLLNYFYEDPRGLGIPETDIFYDR